MPRVRCQLLTHCLTLTVLGSLAAVDGSDDPVNAFVDDLGPILPGSYRGNGALRSTYYPICVNGQGSGMIHGTSI